MMIMRRSPLLCTARRSTATLLNQHHHQHHQHHVTSSVRCFHRRQQKQCAKWDKDSDTAERQRFDIEVFIRNSKKIESLVGPANMPFSLGTEVLATSADMVKTPVLELQLKFYKSHYDKDFEIEEFEEGVKYAFSVVRTLLVSQDLERLKRMCTPELSEALERAFAYMQERNIRIEGEAEEVGNAQVRSLQMREVKDEKTGEERLDTRISVQIAAKESLAMKQDDAAIFGHDQVLQRRNLWVFERRGKDSEWLLSCMLK